MIKQAIQKREAVSTLLQDGSVVSSPEHCTVDEQTEILSSYSQDETVASAERPVSPLPVEHSSLVQANEADSLSPWAIDDALVNRLINGDPAAELSTQPSPIPEQLRRRQFLIGGAGLAATVLAMGGLLLPDEPPPASSERRSRGTSLNAPPSSQK